MRASTKLSWALCVSLFSASFSSRILQVASQAFINMGMRSSTRAVYGWDAMALLIGGVTGPLAAWALSLVLNRKQVMLIAIVIGTLQAILVLSAEDVIQLLVAAGLAGLSNTMMYTIAVLWQAENAEANQRGKKIVLLLIAAAAGSALTTWINFIFNVARPTLAGLRAAVGVQFIFIAVSALLIFFATDSYRWSLSHNKPDEARAALARMRDQDQSSPAVAGYFQSLVHHRQQLPTQNFCSSCASSRKQGGQQSGRLHLHSPRRLGLAAGMQLMAVFTGAQALGLYLSYIMFDLFSQSSHYTSRAILSAFIPTFDLLFTFIPYYLLPRFGLRKLLITGSIGMSICFLISLGIFAATSSTGADFLYTSRGTGLSAAIFTFFLLSFLFFNLSFGILAWVFIAEIGSSLGFHNENTVIACVATSLRYAVEIGVGFAVAWGTIAAGYFLLVAWLLLNLGFAAVVWALYPETAGRTLEDIDLYFARAPRKLVWRDADATAVFRGSRRRTGGENEAGFGHAGDRLAAEMESRRWQHGSSTEARQASGKTGAAAATEW